MFVTNYINKQRNIFDAFCKEYHVQKLYGFGSSVNDSFNAEKSDIDLLVEIDEPDPLKKGEYLMNLWDKLESFFKRKVDLLTLSSVRNPILKESIDKNKVLLYERKS